MHEKEPLHRQIGNGFVKDFCRFFKESHGDTLKNPLGLAAESV